MLRLDFQPLSDIILGRGTRLAEGLRLDFQPLSDIILHAGAYRNR